MSWFDIDREGLAAQLEHRGKAFAIFELVQNAWDAEATYVSITLEPMPGKPFARLVVTDNSQTGFVDLSHAYTMFAPSRRAGDPEKRGRFNSGEKLVLALCREAEIETTTGTVVFMSDGSRKRKKQTRTQGTRFAAEIRMTRDELAMVERDVLRLMPPMGTTLTFNGSCIERPKRLATFTASLRTITPEFRPTMRRTQVDLYPGCGFVYEMGIPVVEADIGYIANVQQKVPLNSDRDNVTPSFVRDLKVAIANHMADDLTTEEATEPWVNEAMDDARVTPSAFQTLAKKRFGERAVVAVPGDPVANAMASANGYTLIHGGNLSAGAWANARKHQIFKRSSDIFPTPTPETISVNDPKQETCPTCKRPM